MDTKHLEGLWATRPIRPSTNRTVAGVCAGFALRYRVDPTLVKIAFVVATLFGGSGLILYIAAWVAMPSEDKQRDELGSIRNAGHALGHRPSHLRHRNPQLILLIVLAIIVVTSFGPNATWSSGGLLGAALMLLGWWLLYQRTPEPPAGTSADTHSPAASGSPAPGPGDALTPWIPRSLMTDPAIGSSGRVTSGTSGGTSWPGPSATTAFNPPATAARTPDAGTPPVSPSAYGETTTDQSRRTPPAWDPLGTARFAWDLPEPAAENAVVPPSERRSPLTLVVVGVAVIVAAAGAALHQVGVDWFTPARIISMALAVVGAGLVIAGLRRRRAGGHSTGLVPIALLLGVAAVVATSAVRLDLPAGGVGERTWTPVAENDIRDEYTLTMGKMVLDLRDVDLTADRTVDLRNGIGEIEILVGENTNIRATCDANVGDYVCPEGLDGGRDGTDGPVLTIDAMTNVGHVEVTR
ncbi:PspC domain-containing protein [Gordonia sp. PKS22-38]|uniref:PspC domain-containing protein n=1 Tax=Gordonia prachuapensis TaxID=3115651 RepID=A0ABU7MQ04_9ACTN|nr:PspC domain-containing protein [Gordonia sp. PKS22-38]